MSYFFLLSEDVFGSCTVLLTQGFTSQVTLLFSDEGSGRFQNITVSVDQACFPVQNALITGQNSLDKSARCYVRYKFYDKGRFMLLVLIFF